MVRVSGAGAAVEELRTKVRRTVLLWGALLVAVVVFYVGCTARVAPNQIGVVQKKFGFETGIRNEKYGPGLYVVVPGTTMHTFPRGIHVLEASNDREESLAKAKNDDIREKVRDYFTERDEALGEATHRLIGPINVQTSDGYAVIADLTLLYSITDPVRVARDFGWGSLYVDSFVVNTFRNGVLATLGKMSAEAFYDEKARISAVREAEALIRKRFHERGFEVQRLLVRNYEYAPAYEKALHDKKVAVQLAEKNRKEGAVAGEKARLQQINSAGNAAITIEESKVRAEISKVKAEADLYSSETHARADQEVNVAVAEGKRLEADALTTAGGKYVVALETSKMFENIEGAVMTPEQYIAFIRNVWSLVGVSPGAGK